VLDELDQRREAASTDALGIRPPSAFAIVDGPSEGGIAILRLQGELDMSAAPVLRARVDAPTNATAMVLDLSGATFVDSAVLKELLRARAELGRRGMRLVLAGVPEVVRRLLDLTRTAELFEEAPDAAAAIRRLSA
jgi:anti-sigma B factor antagonist